ncbi:MAG: hypothetical protein CFH01_00071 [Alphaproteobacteria bacterium MarineAlpha2_Bin1]|nr:MAG: hypothetical protein CFH01_00071 [Alphaproteobacteria bacterium MarineAlpha2_Bin1]|tara:strand:+ start:3675 stop:4376 length:702 start_codon:yes stop_codon:yes gene_type:complete
MTLKKQLIKKINNVNFWIFDLDNTIYNSNLKLFPQVQKRIGKFVSNYLDINITEAEKIQKKFFFKYKSTLKGLMNEHNMKPDKFLDFVHDIDYSILKPDKEFDFLLDQLPGKKYIYTNGSTKHAINVLEHMNISNHFLGVFDIKDANFEPKPDMDSMKSFINKFSINVENALMAEDMAINLEPPHKLGIKTLLVQTEYNWNKEKNLDFIDFKTDDLQGWLRNIIKINLINNKY